MKNLISIIVPVYNVEKYLDKCINSLINQSYKNLEIILIDDGSNDNSREICDEYALEDNRIKVIHKENEGLSATRNLGIDISKGDYIIFIDSDDWVNKDIISKLLNLIKKYNSDIAVCDYSLAYDENEHIEKEKIYEKNFSSIDALKDLYERTGGVIKSISCCKLYKRKLFKDIVFPVGKIHEDEFVTYKLLYKAKRISYINEKLYYYRQRANSIMHSKVDEKCLDALQAFEERLNFIKNNIEDEEVYNLTAKAYYVLILNRYYILTKYCEYKEKYLDYLRKKAKNFYKKNKAILRWPLKLQIIYTSFIFNPKIYIMIEDISRKRKGDNLCIR